MSISDKLAKVAESAAYAVGYGAGKAGKALQDMAADQRAKEALAGAKATVGRAADAVDALADRAAPALRAFAEKAAPTVQDAAGRAAATVRDAVHKAEPAVRRVATQAGQAAAATAKKAGAAARKAGGSAADAARAAASRMACENAAGMRASDARPRDEVNSRTGQRVVVEAYVRRPDGTRDYESVYPQGAMHDFGPLGNKAVGMLLVLAGVPMLLLPGPGVAAIAAGLYFMRKGSGAEEAAGPSGAGGSSAGCSSAARRPASAPRAEPVMRTVRPDEVVPAADVVVTDVSTPPGRDVPADGTGA